MILTKTRKNDCSPSRQNFHRAFAEENGKLLASTISLTNPDLGRFASFTNAQSVSQDIKYELYYDNTAKNKLQRSILDSWIEVYTAYWKIAVALEKSDRVEWGQAFDAMKDLTQ